MRKLVWMISLLIINQLSAQSVISGYVKDVKNSPLKGASIALKDTYDGGITDSTGKYSFKTTIIESI